MNTYYIHISTYLRISSSESESCYSKTRFILSVFEASNFNQEETFFVGAKRGDIRVYQDKMINGSRKEKK